MIRKHGLQVVLVIVGAMFLAGIAAQVLNGYALAQEGQPGAVLLWRSGHFHTGCGLNWCTP